MADEDRRHDTARPAAPVVLDYARPVSETNHPALVGMALGILSLLLAPATCFALAAGGDRALLAGAAWVVNTGLAIGLGVAGLGKSRRLSGEGKRPALLAVGLALSSLVLGAGISMLIPGDGCAAPGASRRRCASNLRQIGQGLMLYANDHGGRYPKGLEPLINQWDLDPACFVCPSSNDDKAQGPTTQAVLADFAKPGRCSFIYLGANLNSSSSDEHVLAYEMLANHNGEGANFLFNDGHVAWIAKAPAAQAIKELEAGQNPPPSFKGMNPPAATQPAVGA